MNRICIAVVEDAYRKARGVFDHASWAECFAAPEAEVELCAAIRARGAQHVIVGVTPYKGELYRTLPRGGVIARFGVGHDSIDKPQAEAAGLLCTNTPAVLTVSVAEFTIALVLALARRLPEAADGWESVRNGPLVGMELYGRKLTILGCGAIGLAVARIASGSLGMSVTGFDVFPVPADRLREAGITNFTHSFNEAVAAADFVSLHIAAVPETRHFLNAARIGAIPAGAFVLNTARGSVLDENALYDALRGGHLRGAALDVTEHEPYLPVDPARDLRSLNNVLLTPHIGSSTQEACDRMAERALRNIQLAGEHRWAEMDLLYPPQSK